MNNNILKTHNIMQQVIIACMPAIIILSYFLGMGIIYNIIYSILFAIILEYFCLKLREKSNQEVFNTVKDYSAILTAILFALCLPPNFSLIKIFIAIFFAIVIAKQIYGGLGHNIFNPAMVGYAVLLISFPQDFTNWFNIQDYFNILDIDNYKNNIDAITQATPLDPIYDYNKINNNYNSKTIFYIINLTWLMSGLYLIYKKISAISLSLGFILGFILILIVNNIANNGFELININNLIKILEQLFLGATMMGAFFIISDPVTAATTPKGRWIYSILAGAFCAIIRLYTSYPDGVAFAVLFMNTWAPLINKLTIQRPKLL